MLENHRITIRRPFALDVDTISRRVATEGGGDPLRWFIAEVTDEAIVVEATIDTSTEPVEDPAPSALTSAGQAITVHLVPTGVGCDIGGYAGDAGPVNALLASASDLVITNPNTVNASNFANLPSNVLYTEGRVIDRWISGRTPLHRPRGNRIGVLIEACDDDTLQTNLAVIDAVRSVHGIDIIGYHLTDAPIGTTCVLNESGAYVGTVTAPEILLAGARALLDAGANAIAVTSKIGGLDAEMYARHFQGEHPNPVGGAEAVVSHLITRAFDLPCAHAPIWNFNDFEINGLQVDARGAGEFASASGLGCVLLGLRQAPQMQARWGLEQIHAGDTRAVVIPATTAGGIPVLAAASAGIPIICVEENRTVLKVTADALGLEGTVGAATYLEAAGLILGIRNGLAAASLRRPLAAVEPVRTMDGSRRG